MQSNKFNSYLRCCKTGLCLILVLISCQVLAVYEIRKYSINNGNTKSSNNRFQLKPSLAQVDASLKLESTTYQLSPGFWQQNTDLIFTHQFE